MSEFDGLKITEEATKRPVVVIVNAQPGYGKTTFALHADKPILIPLGNENVSEMARAKIENATKACPVEFPLTAIRYLLKTNHDYKTVVFDNLFSYKEVIEDKIIKDNPTVTENGEKIQVTNMMQYPYGQGSGFMKPYFSKLLSGALLLRDRKDMNVVFLSQPAKVTIRRDVGNDYDITGLCLPSSKGSDIHTLYTGAADAVLFIDRAVPTKSIKAFGGTKKQAMAGEQTTIVYASPGQGAFYCKNKLGLEDYYEVEESENPKALTKEFNNETYLKIWRDILK